MSSSDGVHDMVIEYITNVACEFIGVRTARLLLQEIRKGGCVDTVSQWIVLLFMALGPEDVGKVRLGQLSLFT